MHDSKKLATATFTHKTRPAKNTGTSDIPNTICMAVNVWIQRPASGFCYVHLY